MDDPYKLDAFRRDLVRVAGPAWTMDIHPHLAVLLDQAPKLLDLHFPARSLAPRKPWVSNVTWQSSGLSVDT